MTVWLLLQAQAVGRWTPQKGRRLKKGEEGEEKKGHEEDTKDLLVHLLVHVLHICTGPQALQ